MPLRFHVLEVTFDQFAIIEDIAVAPSLTPHFLRDTWREDRSRRSMPFLNGIGIIYPIFPDHDLEMLTPKAPSFKRDNEDGWVHPIGEPKGVALRKWHVKLLSGGKSVCNAQIYLRPVIQIYAYGVIRVALLCKVHFPKCVELNDTINALRHLSPNQPGGETGATFQLCHGQEQLVVSCGELFDCLFTKVLLALSPRDSPYSVRLSKHRTAIWLEKVYPWPQVPKFAKEMRGLLFQDPHWEGVSEQEIVNSTVSAWGKFPPDTVLLHKNRALWSFIPFNRRMRGFQARGKRGFLRSSMKEPWMVVGVENVVYSHYEVHLRRIFDELFAARRNVKKRLQRIMKLQFIEAEYITSLAHIVDVHKKLPSPSRKCYHKLASTYRLREREKVIRELADRVVKESDQWTVALTGKISKTLGLLRWVAGAAG